MSKTFTSRPGLTNSRGRGRGSQTRPVQAVNTNRLENTNNSMEARNGARPRQPRVQAPPTFGRDRLSMENEGQLDQQPNTRNDGPDIERRMT